jgi:anion-transporting  ArsA/GET3 family ATPase
MLNNPNVCKLGSDDNTLNNYQRYIKYKKDNIIQKITSSKLEKLEKSNLTFLIQESVNSAIFSFVKKIDIFKVTKRLIEKQARLSELQETIKIMEMQLRMAIIDSEMACSKLNSLITTITWILDEAMVINSQSIKESSVSEAKQPLVLESEAQLSKFLAQQSVAQQLLVLSTQKPLAAQQSSSAVQQLAQQSTDEISLNAKCQRNQ